MSAVTILNLDENNNSIGNGNRRARRPAEDSVKIRKILILFGAVALVGVVATVGVLSPRAGEKQEQIPLSRAARSASLTVESVRKRALEVGSKPPSNLNALERQDDICYTQGCLEAAVHLLDSINFTVNPCDDFFDFACGLWISKNEIPASASRWSQFNILREEVNAITQGILTSEKNDADALPINQVKDLYKDCVNVAALDEIGVQPLRDVLKQHGDWPLLLGDSWETTGFNWLTTIADLRRVYLDTALISVYVDQDYKNADVNTIYIDQPSLVLPRDILLNEEGTYDPILAAYKAYIIEVAGALAAAGGETPDDQALATQADEIIAFETSLARVCSKDEDRSDTERMYNPYQIQEYQVITDAFANLENLGALDWKTFLDSIFSSSGVALTVEDTIIVLERTYFENVTKILEASTPKIVSNYLQLRYVSGLGGETTQAMRDIKFKFNQFLTGAKEPPTREKTCADAANNGLGMAIGVKYIEQTFDDDAKKEVDDMVEDLRVSFKELLASAEWMDDVTKVQAQEKADLMKSFMAYPEWLSNKTAIEEYFKGLALVDAEHFQSITRLSQWSGDKTLKNLRNPVDRNFWLTYPGVVNAFYAPTYNSITFPAGILQPPFFGKGYPAFLNYGGIGVVIGHEITHGFDNSGRQFDKNGNAIPWWTEETLIQYTEKANCIRDQYSAYKPPEVDLNVNGQLTLGENIADNGGLRESYLAYKKYVADNGVEGRLPGLEQFSPDQLFFMGYANIWCEAITVQGLTNLILTDPHSPARFRVRGPLSNNADFVEKWECPVGSTMNPDPAKRCILW